MRTDRYFQSAVTELRKPLLRDAQFRLRAAPEQVSGCGRHHQNVRLEYIDAASGFMQREPFNVRIQQERLVTRRLQMVECEKQLQRIVGLVTAEVGGTGEIPARIYQGKFHEATPGKCSSAAAGTRTIDAAG